MTRGFPAAAGILLLLAGGLLLAACSRQEAAWREASRADTDAAYAAYLEGFPAGTHAAEAQQRVAALREQQEWQRALRFDTPEAYQRYLAGHPAGPHGAEARARLADFLLAREQVAAAPQAAPGSGAASAPPPDAPVAGTLIAAAQDANYRVQLGAFGDGERAARDAWQALRERHPGLLDELAARVDVVTRDGRNLWRLQAGPVSEPRARSLCAELATRGADCVVVPP